MTETRFCPNSCFSRFKEPEKSRNRGDEEEDEKNANIKKKNSDAPLSELRSSTRRTWPCGLLPSASSSSSGCRSPPYRSGGRRGTTSGEGEKRRRRKRKLELKRKLDGPRKGGRSALKKMKWKKLNLDLSFFLTRPNPPVPKLKVWRSKLLQTCSKPPPSLPFLVEEKQSKAK